MRRRDFLGTVAAGVAAAWPGLARAGQAGQKAAAAAKEAAAPRIRANFNSGWLFQRQKHGGGDLGSFDRDAVPGSAVEPAFREAAQAAYDDSSWETVFLPHTWNAVDTSDEIPGYFRGIGWYRKHFHLGEELRGKRIFLEFEGVNQVSEFWLNGARVGEHKGGYTSFEFDVTGHAQFGSAENVLTVKVDNRYDPNIAPTIKTDLTFYGGIYRDVWLRVTDPVYVSALYWRTPRVSEASADVDVFAAVANTTANSARLTVVHEIFDPEGKIVGKSSAPAAVQVGGAKDAAKQTIHLEKPRLWSPDTPHLYRIRTSLLDGERLLDSAEIPLGLRWFSFDADKGFFLNGKRLQLRGTTWHQSYPGMGDALPNSRHFLDMKNIRDMGCNFFRTSHYPHDPAVIEACDRLGLLVLEELFVGEEVENTPAYFEIQAKTAEEMILRDRNNPSVILWGLSGEVDDPENHVDVVNAILRRYRELDPSRIVTMHAPRSERVMATLDVVGLYSTFDKDDEDHKKHPSWKFLIEEYTAAGIGRGIYGMGPESEDLACVQHEEFIRQVNKRPWIAGSALWHEFDYDGEEYDPVIPHVVTFGMADSWRIPKDVYYFYQSQWSSAPVVHICGHWTWPGEEGKTRSVKVYSNLDEVELLLNGKSLGVKKRGVDEGLEQPPRVWEFPYQPGTLQAIGRTGSKTITDTRKTAGAPAAIRLESDVDHVQSGDRESLAYLTASVIDKDGTVVPSAFHPISFTSYGPGELLPQTWPGHPTGFTWNAVAGMAGVAFRSTERVGRAVISAYSPGLALGRTTVNVAAKGKRDEMEYRSHAEIYK